MTDHNIERGLLAALEATGLSWDWLQHRSSGIVLFGSRAAAVASAGSDWDLLCIGPRGPRPSGPVDLVWVDPEYLTSNRWLGSELASHVAAFGSPLCGCPHAWMNSTFVSTEAAERKACRIMGKLSGIETIWPVISMVHRDQQFRALRLELQRLEKLQRGEPVPPTAMLELQWQQTNEPNHWLVEMARRLDIAPSRLSSLLEPTNASMPNES